MRSTATEGPPGNADQEQASRGGVGKSGGKRAPESNKGVQNENEEGKGRLTKAIRE